jgi:streptogramin lyase
MAKYTASAVKRFASPGPQPIGLQAADDGLWCIDQISLKAHKLDWDSGSVLHEIDTETEHSSGITLGDGVGRRRPVRDGALWYCDAETRDIGELVR